MKYSLLSHEILTKIIKALESIYSTKVLEVIFIGSNHPPVFTVNTDLDLVIILENQSESLKSRFKKDLHDRVKKFNIFLDLILIQKSDIEAGTVESKFVWYLIHEQGFFQYNHLNRISLTQKQRNHAFFLKIESLKNELGRSSYKNLLTLAIYVFLEKNKLPFPHKLGKNILYTHFKSLDCSNIQHFSMINSYLTLKDKKEFAPLFNLSTKRKISIFEKLENYINQNL